MPNLAPAGTSLTRTIPRSYALHKSDFGFSDTDGNGFKAVIVTTLPGAGTLYYDANGSLGGGRTAVVAGQAISVADILAGKLTYVAPAGVSGANYAHFTFQVQDNGGTAGGGLDTDQSPNTLTFDLVASAPTASISGSQIDLTGLSAAYGFRILGDAAGDFAGASVSSAGDVNGDGFSDILIGAGGNDSGGINAGAAYVIFGKAGGFGTLIDLTGLSAADGFKIQGDVAMDGAGTVSSAGDVNGDGFADILVGASGNDSGGPSAGAAYVIFGKSGGFGTLIDLTGLSAANGFKIQGDAAYDQAGISVSSAGDVNGDGLADIIVGASGNGGGGAYAGAAYVIFGKSGGFGTLIDLTGLAAADGFKIQGDASGDLAGGSVSSAGDVNGDGFADILVGASDYGGNGAYAGAAWVIFGKSGGFGTVDLHAPLAGNAFRIQGGVAFDHAGMSVSSAGDVNGDGYADILVSSADASGHGAGAAYVIFGRAAVPPNSRIDIGAGLSAADGFKIQGDAAGDNAGISLSSAGDFNGDGYADIIVGAFHNDSGGADAGAAYLIFGKAGGFGSLVDLGTLSAADGFKIQGDLAGDRAGSSVSSAGDVNGDGVADLLVGADRNGGGGANAGAAYVIFGGAAVTRPPFPLVIDIASLAAADGFIIQGDSAGDQAGISVSDAGDVNGDGIADVIVGAPRGGDGGFEAGEAYVLFGGTGAFGTSVGGRQVVDLTSLDPTRGFVIQGDAAGDWAGYSVSSAGDVNGDGIGDIIVGALFGDDGGTDAGEAYVVFGSVGGFGAIDGAGRRVLDLTGLTAAQGFVIQGDSADDRTGASVSSAGDVNGDGFDDLIVGAGYGHTGRFGAGDDFILFGHASPFGTAVGGRQVVDLTTMSGSDGFYLVGAQQFGLLGLSVSTAGDVNGDGIDDLIVGARRASYGASTGVNEGAAYVVFGTRNGFGTTDGSGRHFIDLLSLTPSQGFVILGDSAGDYAGASVSSAGDINGDGIDDLIIGAPRGGDGGQYAGEAYIVFGSTGGFGTLAGGRRVIDLTSLSPAQGFIVQGDVSGNNAGISVSAAGDVNGDGIDDLIIGAPALPGAAYVLFGSRTGFGSPGGAGRQVLDLSTLNASQGFIVRGDSSFERAGQSVSGAGDINGDGVDDLIIGAYKGTDGGSDAGEAYVIFGRRVAPANTAPTLHANAGLIVAEGATATITAATLDYDDAEQADSAITYTLTSAATNGSLRLNGIAIGLGATFTQADLNANLLSYQHNGGETISAAFGFSVSDGAGGSVTGQSFAITVTPVNDAPVLADANVALAAIDEDPGAPVGAVGTLVSSLVSLGGNVTDPDSGGVTGIAVTNFDTSHGNWFITTDGGATWLVPFGQTDSSALLLAADANTRLYFLPNANYNGTLAAAITFRAWDQSTGGNGGSADTTTNGGSTAFSSATDTASLVINAIDDKPTISAIPNITAGEQVARTIYNQMAVADTELGLLNGGNGDYAGSSFVIHRVGTPNASDSFDFNTSGAGFTVSGNNLLAGGLIFATMSQSGGTLEVDFTSAQTIATKTLKTSVFQHLRYTNLSDNPEASLQLELTFIDGAPGQGQGTIVGANGDRAVQTFTVTMIAVNDAPVLADTNVVLASLGEDSGAPVGAVGSLVSSLVNLTPPAGGQDNVTDADNGAVTGMAVIGADSHGSWYYTLDNGAHWTPFGTVSDPTALLLPADANTRVYFQPNADLNGTLTAALTFRAWDQTVEVAAGAAGDKVDASGVRNGGASAFSTATDTAKLTVTATNDAPVVVNGTTATLAAILEDAANPAGDTVANLFGTHYSDAADDQSAFGGSSAGTFRGIAVTSNASSAATGHWQYFSGTSWIDIGTAAAIDNAYLFLPTAQLRFLPAANYNGPAPDLVAHLIDNTLTPFNDGDFTTLNGFNGGTTPFSSGSVTLGETINAVNDAPVNYVPAGTLHPAEDTSFTFTGGNLISITDVDAGSDDLEVALGVSHGKLSLSDTTGLSFAIGDGTADLVMDFHGSLAAINAALAGLSYMPAPDYNGADSLSIDTSDLGHNGGAALSDSDSVNLGVDRVNDAPLVVNGTSATLAPIAEGAANPPGDTVANLFAGHFSDPADNGSSQGDFKGIAVTGNGSSAATGQWQWFDGSTWKDIGPAAIDNAQLYVGTTLIRFLPVAHYNGPAPDLVAHLADTSIAFSSGEFTNITGFTGGTTPYSTGTVTLGETITSVDDPPVNAFPTTASGLEDSANPFTGIALDPPPAWIVDPDNASVSTHLTVLDGLLAAAGLSGATVAGSGSSDLTITGSPTAVSATLQTLTYTPVADFFGTRVVTVTTSDGELSDTDTITWTIANVPDLPTSADASVAVTEDVAKTLDLSMFAFSDVDGDSLRGLVLASVPAHGQLLNLLGDGGVFVEGSPPPPPKVLHAGDTIDVLEIAAGVIVYVPAADYNGPDSFRFAVVDSGPAGHNQDDTPNTISFNIAAVNDAPVANATGTNHNFTENGPPLPFVDAVTISDVDNSRFAGGSLSISASDGQPDDGVTILGNLGLDVDFGAGTIEFNGRLIANVTGPGQLGLTANADASAVSTLIRSIAYTNASDDPTGGTRHVQILFTDGSGSANGGHDSVTIAATITVIPVNDPPVWILIGADRASFDLGEGDGTLAATGSLTVRDPELADAITLSVPSASASGNSAGLPGSWTNMLSGTSGSIAANAGDLHNARWTFDSGAFAFNYLGAGQTVTLDYVLRATDGGGATADQHVVLTIHGTNDAPTANATGTAHDFTENDPPLALVDAVTIADVDNSRFGGGTLTFGASDGQPGDGYTVLGSLGLDYDAGAGTIEYNGRLLATFIAPGQLSLTANADAASVELLIRSLAFTNASDDPVGGTRHVSIALTDGSGTADGGHDKVTIAATVNVIAVNDPPAWSLIGADSAGAGIDEANAGLAATGTLTVNDPELADAVTLSIVPGSASGNVAGLPSGWTNMLQATSGSIPANPGDVHNARWTFDSAGFAFDYLASGETVSLDYLLRATDGSGATADQHVVVTIHGTEEAPVISVATGDSASLALNETNTGLAGSGTLTVVDADLSDTVTTSVLAIAKAGTIAGLLPGDAQLLAMLGLTAGPIAANPGDAHNLGWTFNSGSEAFDYLDEGETLTLTYTVRASDSNGGHDDQDVTVTITGTNDAPILTLASASDSDSAALADGSAPLHAQGTLTALDPDLSDSVTASLVGVTGSLPIADPASMLGMLHISPTALAADPGAGAANLGWSFSAGAGAFDWLATGQTQTLSYTLRITDDSGATADHVVTIAITGTNEAPVILSALPPSTAEVELPDGSPGENATLLSSGGTISFADSDATDTHGAAVTPQGGAYLGSFTLGAVDEAAGKLGWTFSVGDALLNSLGAGQILHQLYDVTIDDGHGGTATRSIAVDLIGSNDAAILSSADVVKVQDSAPITASGTLTISDVDGPALFQPVSGRHGSFGTLTMSAVGDWSYLADSAYLGLAPGEVLSDVFTVLAADGTPTTISVSIAGSNDIASARIDRFITDEAHAIGAGLNLFADNGAGPDTDPDSGLAIAAVNGDPTLVGHAFTLVSGARLTVNSDGTFVYDPNHAFDSLSLAPGAMNQFAYDVFNYRLAGGTTASVLIRVNGLPTTADLFEGTISDNVITGDDRANIFMLQQGGHDTAYGLGGNDGFFFGGAFDSGDTVDGGDGTDTIALQGNTDATMDGVTNVEVVLALSGSDTRFGDTANHRYDYDLTTHDGDVAAGQTLTVQATGLLPGEDMHFDGSAEMDGNFRIFAGQGVDDLIGGGGNDGFFFGADGNLTGADHVDGGAGIDSLALRGNYVGANALVFTDSSFANIEVLAFLSGHSNEFSGVIVPAGFDYDVTMADGNVAAGHLLDVNAARLGADESLRFDGRLETNGSFRILSGAGDDTLWGGSGNDTLYGGLGKDALTGGAGADIYLYRSAAESTSTGYDTITGFDWHVDRIDAPGGTRALSQSGSGALSTASFDADLSAGLSGVLGAGQAALFTATSGTLAGHIFAVIDANGVAGYQAGQDLVIELVAPVTPIDPVAGVIL